MFSVNFAIDFSEVIEHHLIDSLVVKRLCRIGLDLQTVRNLDDIHSSHFSSN